MAGKIKYGKIALVVFITALIWIWVDLKLDEEYAVKGAVVRISESPDPELWVSFQGKSSVPIESIVVRGPASKITNLKQNLSEGPSSLEFVLFPEQRQITSPGRYPVNAASVLRESDQMEQWGLTVESCEPQTVMVEASKLVEKSLSVKCVNDNGTPLTAQKIEPAQVQMSVPEDWVGQATVELSASEITQARAMPVEKTPYVRLPGGQIKNAAESVAITMPADSLQRGTVTNVKLGIIYSLNLQGEYKAKIDNMTEVLGNILVRATPEAKRAFEDMRYQVVLEIDDSYKDADPDIVQKEELIYNLPSDFVMKGEIVLDPQQQPISAQFKLVPVGSSGIAD
ncbi:hypothetical protein ACFL1G_06770 [Planctomycetota bacterium]